MTCSSRCQDQGSTASVMHFIHVTNIHQFPFLIALLQKLPVEALGNTLINEDIMVEPQFTGLRPNHCVGARTQFMHVRGTSKIQCKTREMFVQSGHTSMNERTNALGRLQWAPGAPACRQQILGRHVSASSLDACRTEESSPGVSASDVSDPRSAPQLVQSVSNASSLDACRRAGTDLRGCGRRGTARQAGGRSGR